MRRRLPGQHGRICQFTFVCDGSLYRAPALGAWQQAEQVAAAALAGYVETSVGEATHYHADYVAPRWAPLLAKVAQIGQHIFYRWPGAWGQPAAFTGRYIGEPRDPLSMRPPLPSIAIRCAAGDPAIAAGAPARRSRAPTTTSAGCSIRPRAGRSAFPGPDDSDGAAARLVAVARAQGRSRKVAAADAPAVIASALDSRVSVQSWPRFPSSDPRSGTASR